MKHQTMKLPKGINKKWWVELFMSASSGEEVSVCKFWDMTEITFAGDYGHHIATFRSHKHALEFCKLNKLNVIG